MAADFTIKQGDTRPWNLVLKENAAAVDLTAASSVALYMRKRGAGSTNKIDGSAVTIVTAASGIVRYTPSSADVDTAGTFDAYFKVTWGDATLSRFPSRPMKKTLWWNGSDLKPLLAEIVEQGADNVRLELRPDMLLYVVPKRTVGFASKDGETGHNFVHTCPPDCPE